MINDLKFCDIEKLSSCFILGNFLIENRQGDPGQEIYKNKKTGERLSIKITREDGSVEYKEIE
jgi:hypothetical protein